MRCTETVEANVCIFLSLSVIKLGLAIYDVSHLPRVPCKKHLTASTSSVCFSGHKTTSVAPKFITAEAN